MKNHASIILPIALIGILAEMGVTDAQTTFQNYRCADGTNFIVAFYPLDRRAHLQIDGHEATLSRRLGLSERRYSGAGVTLRFTSAGRILIKHVGRPQTACELI
jgi:hypothetical protein